MCMTGDMRLDTIILVVSAVGKAITAADIYG